MPAKPKSKPLTKGGWSSKRMIMSLLDKYLLKTSGTSGNLKPQDQPKSLLSPKEKHKKNRIAAVDMIRLNLTHKGLDKYDMIKELGRGAFGKVMLAVDKKSGKKYAIKIQLNDGNEELFTKEISLLKKISKYCDNLICIREYGMSKDKMHYIVMDYATGMSLTEFVAGYNVSTPGIISIINQIINTVKLLHDNGIAHSDIKPDNIQIDPSNFNIRLLDLGLACDNVKYCSGGGTRVFMPEDFSRDLEGRKSTDVWAIAATLLFMLVDNKDSNKLYKILESKDFGKLKHIIKPEYFEIPEFEYILMNFLDRNQKHRLLAFERYIDL